MRHYLIILDELWRALIAGRGMVDRTNSLTRLNRQWGVGVVMCSHTIKDLLVAAGRARADESARADRALRAC